ncbi:MAG: molybdopterin molybdotransferase [Rhodobacteraceae bacterium HLUCCA12]|nr:MAG: molybdopterin molybdotransferase [Rhodobacteraceae bacterium HLUCCA12]
MRFDRIAILDWSAASSPKRGKDSIWLGLAGPDGVRAENLPTRSAAEDRLRTLIQAALDAGERLLIGADFAFGYPAGFAAHLTGRAQSLAVWEWLAGAIADDAQNRSNRLAVAAGINRRFPGAGPFWFNPTRLDLPDLPRRASACQGHGDLAEFRATDRAARGAQSVWKLGGAGAVGSQTLTGLPVLWRLRGGFAGQVAVWPFEPVETSPVVLAEVFPSVLSAQVESVMSAQPMVRDEAQVRLLAETLWHVQATDAGLAALFAMPRDAKVHEEGWILGAGHEATLKTAAQQVAQPAGLTPPRLRDDCFAMPQGVEWVPVDEALGRLRAALVPLTGVETVALAQAGGRVLASDATARRANPPQANAAVDGYGFAHAALDGPGPYTLPLVAGRAAAGQPLADAVPPGQAVRILTGAILPQGVDTVVLDEDCATDGHRVAFDGPVRPRANTRRAGEDVAAGAMALAPGRVLGAPDLALMSALGIGQATVFRRLRVGVLSTGDEIVANPAAPAAPHQVFDANRPMLMDIARRWGFVPVDLGHAPDDPARIAAALDRGAREADVILTSGGASAGDEDHVSRLLRDRGTLSSWRIALKPGRPLALALWNGVPVLGLPGNPVAAFVCTLIFGRPTLSRMAGSGWRQPQGFDVPAAFSKTKKPGRREYLRARINAHGAAEVFASEGSGRISGLSWADGLVELPDDAAQIEPGTPVRYLPFASFGL